jgi:predicted nucleic acid-binding protein
MADGAVELADTSAWTNRHKGAEIRFEFDRRIIRGEIATCEIVKLELLWNTQGVDDFRAARSELDALPHARIDRRVWRRATDVFEELASPGPLHHRTVKIPDLLIAAAAELAELPLCHYDRDFELIAGITGQPVRAIAPLGSL